METQKFNISTIFVFIFLTFFYTTTSTCLNSACRRDEPVVRFPFRLQDRQPSTCGWPGFDLSCSRTKQTFLNIKNYGPFIVQGIDYAMQEMWINDPDFCLPRRLLTLNLSNSPFKGVFTQNFTLFKCSSAHRMSSLDPIACLSGINYTVFATASTIVRSTLASTCDLIATISVPVQWLFSEGLISSDLSDDLRLGWGTPDCSRCEIRGRRCGFINNSTREIECKTRRGKFL